MEHIKFIYEKETMHRKYTNESDKNPIEINALIKQKLVTKINKA